MSVVTVLLVFALLLGSKPGHATGLHDAAGQGNLNAVRALLEAGADLNARDRFGRTPLHEAAAAGFVAAVELLLANGADPNAKDHSGLTPIHEAVRLSRKMGLRNDHDGAALNAFRALLNEASDPSVADASSRLRSLLQDLARRRQDVPRYATWNGTPF